MNKNFTLIIVSLLCFITASQIHSQSIPEILYYKFDGTGTNVPNYASAPPVGTATGIIMGSITQGSSNLCEGSLIGSGNASSTDYLYTGWATDLTGFSWTISFRSSDITASSTLFYIFGDANAGSFRCFTNGVAGPNNWILRGTGITDVIINGMAVVAPHMVTFVYDMGANTIYGYADGTLVTSVVQGGPVITGTGPFKVMGYATNVGSPAGGKMDEFRVYSHALTALEVAELYNPYAISGFLGADQIGCLASDSVMLNLAWPTSNVSWSNGSINDTAYINAASQVIVTLSGACASGADTINIIDATTFSSLSPSQCGTSYVSPGGSVYNASGIYTDTIANNSGCDSLITINLELLPATTGTINTTTCGEPYTSPSGNIYTLGGTYLDTIPNSLGCDSVITINITVNTVNTLVVQSGSQGENLLANLANATYQWIDCSNMSPVSGETDQSFTATDNGSYAVIITQNSCTDTSACLTVAGLGLYDNALANQAVVFPNPTDGNFTIDLGYVYDMFTVEIVNQLGQTLETKNFYNISQVNMNLNAQPGSYFVRITANNGNKAVLRIIKK